MKLILFSIILLTSTVTSLYAQKQISGQIVDSKEKAIHAVSIRVNNVLTARSNNMGDFLFMIDNDTKFPIRISFSSLGYKDTSITLLNTNDILKIKLNEEFLEIEEVEIYPESFVHRLLQNSLKNRLDSAFIKREILCQQSLFTDTKLFRYAEGLFNIDLDVSAKRKTKAELLQTRSIHTNCLHPSDNLPIVTYSTGLRQMIDPTYQLYKATIFNPTHQYNIVGISIINGTPCYKIAFTRPEAIQDTEKHGIIYITKDKNLIKRVETIIVDIVKNTKSTYLENYSEYNNKALLNTIEFSQELLDEKIKKHSITGKMNVIVTNLLPDNVQVKNNYSNAKSKQDLTKNNRNEKADFDWNNYYIMNNLILNKYLIDLNQDCRK